MGETEDEQREKAAFFYEGDGYQKIEPLIASLEAFRLADRKYRLSRCLDLARHIVEIIESEQANANDGDSFGEGVFDEIHKLRDAWQWYLFTWCSPAVRQALNDNVPF
jgi:hypothetical protein